MLSAEKMMVQGFHYPLPSHASVEKTQRPIENLHLKTRSTPMSEKPISPLRQRMIEDMTVREISEKTQSHYIRHNRTA